jgi:glutamate-5-semialdehyde dehydrogenase
MTELVGADTSAFTADAAADAVARAARQAGSAAPALAAAGPAAIEHALRAMASRLPAAADPVLAANAADHDAAVEAGMGPGLRDRLRLSPERLRDMAGQLTALAAIAPEPTRRAVRDLGDGLLLEEWRRPVGVIGANFEARPTVVVDIASQLVKSGNAGVLRTGSAALRSAVALVDHVVAPALADAGLPPGAVQLVRTEGHEAAEALVRQPGLVPLVILRGSGETTRHLAQVAAAAGVRTLAHADGGAVVYVDAAADWDTARDLIARSLDRLGVCNRLNLLLLDRPRWSQVEEVVDLLAAREPKIAASLPPHPHPLGWEWALTDADEATVTIAPADGAADAARIANEQTSGLAATVVTEDAAVAREFLAAYAGTGAFWNATPRLLDGFKLLSVPETGINIDRVPGPRGPVTFRDLYLRQYVIVPAARRAELDG